MSKYGNVTLDDGKYYVDGTNNVIRVRRVYDESPINVDVVDSYPFEGANGFRYRADGRYIPDDDSPVSKYSLVREFRGIDPEKAATVLQRILKTHNDGGADTCVFENLFRVDIFTYVERRPC